VQSSDGGEAQVGQHPHQRWRQFGKSRLGDVVDAHGDVHADPEAGDPVQQRGVDPWPAGRETGEVLHPVQAGCQRVLDPGQGVRVGDDREPRAVGLLGDRPELGHRELRGHGVGPRPQHRRGSDSALGES
jgi:hypothetical protein